MNEVIEKLDKQGERAFPFVTPEFFAPGMTLRDYFAAKAMQGMLNRPILELAELAESDIPLKDYLAKTAYALAEAMLKAREQ
jgi:transglutaminase/protease-like cytokinesis protein 3